MTTYGVRLPDVGEGVAEAELISWLVQVGDRVTTESMLAEVMTDKATVEVASPVTGVVTALVGEPGDVLAVGAELVIVELDPSAPPPRAVRAADEVPSAAPPTATSEVADATSGPAVGRNHRDEPRPHVLAAPAVRARAARLGIDLATVRGTGPDGRVVHDDLDRLLVGRGGSAPISTPGASSGAASAGTHVEPIRGIRRRIAQRTAQAWAEIPHITYVDAVDVTEVEALRAELNREQPDARLTLLPFVARAIVLACAEQPGLNAHLDEEATALTVHDAVHVGIATQTDDGLTVPVVHHAERLDVRELAAEIVRVTGAARAGTATRDELTGSTITITSLGALGGLVTTPIINRPEVAIIGVNRIETRPVWRDGAFQPRQVCNLSSSFDHRVVDGWDAATFVGRIRRRLELPALLFT